MLHKFGSNLNLKMKGNSINSVNSVHRLSYTAGDLQFASRRTHGRPRLHAGMEKSPAWLPCASESLYLALAIAVCPAPLLCFSSRRRHSSGELASPPQRRCRLGKGRPSSVFSLRIQPANLGRLKLPRIRCPRLSSSRPATSPPRACHRGQSHPVSRCP